MYLDINSTVCFLQAESAEKCSKIYIDLQLLLSHRFPFWIFDEEIVIFNR